MSRIVSETGVQCLSAERQAADADYEALSASAISTVFI